MSRGRVDDDYVADVSVSAGADGAVAIGFGMPRNEAILTAVFLATSLTSTLLVWFEIGGYGSTFLTIISGIVFFQIGRMDYFIIYPNSKGNVFNDPRMYTEYVSALLQALFLVLMMNAIVNGKACMDGATGISTDYYNDNYFIFGIACAFAVMSFVPIPFRFNSM